MHQVKLQDLTISKGIKSNRTKFIKTEVLIQYLSFNMLAQALKIVLKSLIILHIEAWSNQLPTVNESEMVDFFAYYIGRSLKA